MIWKVNNHMQNDITILPSKHNKEMTWHNTNYIQHNIAILEFKNMTWQYSHTAWHGKFEIQNNEKIKWYGDNHTWHGMTDLNLEHDEEMIWQIQIQKMSRKWHDTVITHATWPNKFKFKHDGKMEWNDKTITHAKWHDKFKNKNIMKKMT